MMQDLERRIAAAVRHFWQTRTRQRKHQGTRTGRRDYGNRTAATGGIATGAGAATLLP